MVSEVSLVTTATTPRSVCSKGERMHDERMSGERMHVEEADAVEWLGRQADDSVDLLFTSPPYTRARTYGIAADRSTLAWVEWMRPREACRVSAGLAFFNVSDVVEDCEYQNGPEWLHTALTREDGLAAVRPYAWLKMHPRDEDAPNNGQPGSGGKHFHRNAWEPVYGYAMKEKLPPRWSDNIAFGAPPRHNVGGKVTQRGKDGSRRATGRMGKLGHAGQPAICNPGNVIKAIVGGGHLGHALAHEGEAPMPLSLAERFVCWFCPPDGIVCDPFAGSGTTAHAAILHGRRFVGCDVRASQVALTKRRLATVTANMFV